MSDEFNIGAFVPTTQVWDVSRIYDIKNINSQEFRELFVRLHQNINNIALSLNIRDAGYYVQEEFVNGQLYFPDPNLDDTTGQVPQHRQVFRKVINFGALPNNATKSVAHGLTLTSTFTFTRIYGTASDTTGFNYIPIPYAARIPSDRVELYVDSTNVNIDALTDRTAFDKTYVVLEYIKQ